MTGALSGLRVLDLPTLLPGPMVNLFLGETGEGGIKVEMPNDLDQMRNYVPRQGEDGVDFNVLSRGKRNIELDLKSDEGRAKLMALIKDADTFGPGVMKRPDLPQDAPAATIASRSASRWGPVFDNAVVNERGDRITGRPLPGLGEHTGDLTANDTGKAWS